ncbi:MAG: D-alanyl-D-alanine carboxypeptidase family protein [Ruminococcaceae bacterium]|nr:D-alanyl-D-alanine carboxypeptidase family protein [Oscillospiraceae bacterium]
MEGHMKRNSAKIFVAILAVLLLFSGCINTQEEEETTTSINMNNVNPSSVGSYKTMEYQYLTNIDVASLTTNLDKTYLILANKTNELASTYEPSGLTTLTCETTYSMKLEGRAAQALYVMLLEMRAAGVSDIAVTSAYRSYEYQVNTYNGWVQEEMKAPISEDAYRVLGQEYIKMNYLDKKIYSLNLADAHKVAQSYSALPGQSEHQTGLCVDFITSEMNGELTEEFETTEAFEWLSKNAYKFGFILRYPKGKENITGYTYEPWHYRFVGREAATDIYVGDMTLEQYLQLTSN